MYNEQIENLINLAIADGELTEQEKQMLFKKAESFGIDLDEFEVVLEAKLFAKNNTNNEPVAAPKSDKLGDVKKCPACGAIAESFSTKCQDCGSEFRNLEASHNIMKFFEKLDELESHRKENLFESKENSSISIGTLLKWVLFYWILIPLKLINFLINKSKSATWSTTDLRKEELILNFPVPNSREEIFEFLNLSLSKIDTISYMNLTTEKGTYMNAWNNVWMKKMDQINMKARLYLKNDKKSYEELQILVNEAKARAKTNKQRFYHILIGFTIVLITFILIFRFA
jgi:hypothetical protein